MADRAWNNRVTRSALLDLSSTDATVRPTTALLVDTSGAVKVTYAEGAVDTVTLSAGVWHPMSVKLVWKTGTTATGVHAGY